MSPKKLLLVEDNLATASQLGETLAQQAGYSLLYLWPHNQQRQPGHTQHALRHTAHHPAFQPTTAMCCQRKQSAAPEACSALHLLAMLCCANNGISDICIKGHRPRDRELEVLESLLRLLFHRSQVGSGIVSALGRNVPEGEGGAVIFNAIQMDAPINPGNSGGALVDLQGDLVGIPTLTIVNPSFNTPASGLGFSIPANRAAFIVPQLIQSSKVTNHGLADLGLAGTTVDATAAARLHLPVTQGVLVASVLYRHLSRCRRDSLRRSTKVPLPLIPTLESPSFSA